jgi:hypothetical protein
MLLAMALSLVEVKKAGMSRRLVMCAGRTNLRGCPIGQPRIAFRFDYSYLRTRNSERYG